jgi:hypothetical protein
MPHGFGSDFTIPGPPKPFDGNSTLTITVEVGYFIDLGHGPFKIYPEKVIRLPSLPSLKCFIETGQLPVVPPFLP